MSRRKSSPAIWDLEYRMGRWDYLASLEQLPRYAVLASWCRRLCRGPSILDVGCGEGLLLEHLRGPNGYRYYGIDFAPTAIERAQERIIDPDCEAFKCIAVEHFDIASAAPDIVVFNESLYCCDEPRSLLLRYLQCVGNGFVLLSITEFDAAFAAQIRRIHAERMAAAVLLEDGLSGKAWHLMVLSGTGPDQSDRTADYSTYPTDTYPEGRA